MSAKRTLNSFRAPDERGAEERAWEVVRAAYRERAPGGRRDAFARRAGVVAASIVAVGVVALSPAGATVGRLVDRALGVQHPAPGLFSLPAPGRILVSGAGGTWIVAANGSARRIGAWRQASWSPHGLYLTVAARDELAAVSTRGVLQWTLIRPDVSDPRWYAPSGYRVAYLSGGELRDVAGDGTGDHLLAAPVEHVAPAWRPGHPYQLAYVTAAGGLVVRDAGTGAKLWSANPGVRVHELAWSADGQRLLALASTAVLLYAGDGRRLSTRPAPAGGSIVGGALSPDGRTLAVVTDGSSSTVTVYSDIARHPVVRRVLAGLELGQVAWSPNGQWVLVSWPAADQWVFVRVAGKPRIAAVSRISQQFSSRLTSARFPALEGWCCNARGAAG